MNSRRPIPPLEPFDKQLTVLAEIVAGSSWFPNPEAVGALGHAIFPTVRASRLHPRFSFLIENGETVGMYDDNTTPTWAFLWAHGISGGNKSGWMFAHVWPCRNDIDGYTNLANIIMVPECFGGLTDKNAPLTTFLRWHSWRVYGWRPKGLPEPQKPDGYEKIKWRYLEGVADPKDSIRGRLDGRNNNQLRILRPIMQRLEML